MAKARLPKNLTSEMPTGRAAGGILDAKTDEILAYADLAMSGDVDGVHDMRVAAKRLREAMRLFRPALPRRRGKALIPLVEQLNDALGLVRDRDVLTEHGAWVASQADGASEFLDGLRARWAQEKAGYLEELVSLWRRLSGAERLEARVRNCAARTRRHKRPLNAMPYDRFGYFAITRRADRVRSRVPEAVSADDPAALHRLRIFVKRLKYTMEPFRPVLPALDDPYGTVSDVQEALGLAHDFDVLRDFMVHHAQEGSLEETATYRAALDVVDRHRADLYAAAKDQARPLADESWYRALLDAAD